jgi:hypothetical protein
MLGQMRRGEVLPLSRICFNSTEFMLNKSDQIEKLLARIIRRVVTDGYAICGHEKSPPGLLQCFKTA